MIDRNDIIKIQLQALKANKAKNKKANSYTVYTSFAFIVNTGALILCDYHWGPGLTLLASFTDFLYRQSKFLYRIFLTKQVFKRSQSELINFLEHFYDNSSQFSGHAWVTIEELNIIINLDNLQMFEECSLVTSKNDKLCFSIKLKSKYIKKATALIEESISKRITIQENIDYNIEVVPNTEAFTHAA